MKELRSCSTKLSKDQIELVLNERQTELFQSLIREQREGGKVGLLCIVSHSYDPFAGEAVVKLQMQLVNRKCAAKVARILAAEH
jgi:hypothetical protein